ncbi:MAG: hypothetical protein Q9160_005912 [Pyrenula sp. 1 TL-2023]
MDRLPLEILDMILQLCNRRVLKALRLTNSTFSTPVLRYLFRTIKITTHPQDFGYLPKIARHPEIRKHVREFVYDTRMTETNIESGTCEEAEENQIREEMNAMSEEQLKALELWGLFMRGAQDQIGSKIDDATEIRRSIARFPALEHVTLSSGPGPFGPPTDFIENMNDIQRHLLFLDIAPPNASGGWETNNARTMALFRSLSAIRQPLRSLTLNGLNWDFLSCCSKTEIKQLHRQIKEIHILNVAIKIPLTMEMVPRHVDCMRCVRRAAYLIGDFIASATGLETLTLTFFQVDRQQSNLLLQDIEGFQADIHGFIMEAIIAQEEHWQLWPSLRNLALNNIAFAHPKALRLLIQSCSTSLRRLRMSNIHLMQGNWLCMLRLIPSFIPTHNLEQFVLSHEITSEYEHWDVQPRQRGSRSPKDCLRDQVEQWVEDGGDKCGRPFPLLPEYVPLCQVHFRPSPTRFRELREMTRQHIRAGDRSLVWRYDCLQKLWVFNEEPHCQPDCPYRFSGHVESPKDTVEGDGFDIAEVYGDDPLQNDDPLTYTREEIEYMLLGSQEIGWQGMFEFDPQLDPRFMCCAWREQEAKAASST